MTRKEKDQIWHATQTTEEAARESFRQWKAYQQSNPDDAEGIANLQQKKDADVATWRAALRAYKEVQY